MSRPTLHVATLAYDHMAALYDGRVTIDGADARFSTAPIVSDIFAALLRDHAHDVAELGLTYYLRTLDRPDPPFVALPVFLARSFRHSAVYVNPAAGIERPEDLNGRRIGELALYGHDGGVWPKGVLADDFGFLPETCRWVIGGSDVPLPPFDFVAQPHPDGVEVTHAPEGTTLGAMLEAGEIDALISARTPQALLRGSPHVARLFADHEPVERAWFARTGIFPIMHTVVVRREVLAGRPDLARALYDAFLAAKDDALERYRAGGLEQHMTFTTPWMTPLVQRNRELMGDDWWPYGVAANHTTLDTFLRYFAEQGLSSRRRSVEELFVPELLDT